MARQSVAEKFGYKTEFADRPDGRVDVTVKDQEGEVVYTRDSANRAAGISAVGNWVRKKHPEAGPGSRVTVVAPGMALDAVTDLRHRANQCDAAAQQLRDNISDILTNIETFERDARNLRQAADALDALNEAKDDDEGDTRHLASVAP